MSNRMKKIERRKLHTLSPGQVQEMRQRQIAENEASRKLWRQRHQKRSQWGHNEYVDDDFVSRMLVKWTLRQLIQYSKLLILLINRRTAQPSECALPNRIASLVHYTQPSEYYDTLFADYTYLEHKEDELLNFRAYYTLIYKEAVEAVKESLLPERRRYHVARLRACFMVALTYDARIRRFVFSKHDIHYEYMQTHPPPMKKTSHFIVTLQPLVNQFLQQLTVAETLSDQACAIWISTYMFLLE